MPEPNSIEQVAKVKDLLELAIAIGGVAVVPIRWTWNLGTRIKDLEDKAASMDKTVSDFKDQAVKVLDTLADSNEKRAQRLDDAMTANIQSNATVHAELKALGDKVQEIRDRCYGSDKPACEENR